MRSGERRIRLSKCTRGGLSAETFLLTITTTLVLGAAMQLVGGTTARRLTPQDESSALPAPNGSESALEACPHYVGEEDRSWLERVRDYVENNVLPAAGKVFDDGIQRQPGYVQFAVGVAEGWVERTWHNVAALDEIKEYFAQPSRIPFELGMLAMRDPEQFLNSAGAVWAMPGEIATEITDGWTSFRGAVTDGSYRAAGRTFGRGSAEVIDPLMVLGPLGKGARIGVRIAARGARLRALPWKALVSQLVETQALPHARKPRHLGVLSHNQGPHLRTQMAPWAIDYMTKKFPTRADVERLIASARAGERRPMGPVSDLLALVPRLGVSTLFRYDVERLTRSGWTFRLGPPGHGTYTDRANKVIVIDSAESRAGLMDASAHEVGHAVHPLSSFVKPPWLYKTRENFVAFNTRRGTLLEARAELYRYIVYKELETLGMPEPVLRFEAQFVEIRAGLPGSPELFSAMLRDDDFAFEMLTQMPPDFDALWLAHVDGDSQPFLVTIGRTWQFARPSGLPEGASYLTVRKAQLEELWERWVLQGRPIPPKGTSWSSDWLLPERD